MTINVKNTDYYTWNLTVEQEKDIIENGLSHQQMIDKYFDPSDENVEDATDPYYEEDFD